MGSKGGSGFYRIDEYQNGAMVTIAHNLRKHDAIHEAYEAREKGREWWWSRQKGGFHPDVPPKQCERCAEERKITPYPDWEAYRENDKM